MRYRNIVIANPARLSLKRNQLVIEQNETYMVPVEDIMSLMLESRAVTVTTGLLTALSQAGAVVFVCDEKHLPAAELLASDQFSRKRRMLDAQYNLGRPFSKQLWKSIVVKKIRNQALCLRYLEKPGWEEIMKLSEKVHSGDSGNAEATAAAKYFPLLFGKGFVRRDEDPRNAALNYGYAILRGAVARDLVTHGLEPCLGLFHSGELNAFNLADDLLEPYRPLVDLFTASWDWGEEEEFNTDMKRKLFNLTNYLVEQGGKRFRVMMAIDRAAATLARSIEEEKPYLELPDLIPLEEGRYE